MTTIEKLIEVSNRLCNSLEMASENENLFCFEMQNQLEKMSWETLKMTNELKEIKEYMGG